MAYQLKPTYGKQSVPVFKIRKNGGHHTIIDMIVKIMLQGRVDDSWLSGENHQIVPTETQKNTCYALALKTEFDCGEDYAIALSGDMLRRHTHLDKVTVWVEERRWNRANVNGQPHNHVFLSGSEPIRRKCRVVAKRGENPLVFGGISDVKLMKTTQSGFKGFIEDQYTNLKPVGAGGSAPDRIMCTLMEAEWEYSSAPAGGYANAHERVLSTLLEVFGGDPTTGVFSKSLQETAYNMLTTVLEREPAVREIWCGTPNIHFYTYPLEQFGLSNPNVVFQSTTPDTTASGRIETRVARATARL